MTKKPLNESIKKFAFKGKLAIVLCFKKIGKITILLINMIMTNILCEKIKITPDNQGHWSFLRAKR